MPWRGRGEGRWTIRRRRRTSRSAVAWRPSILEGLERRALLSASHPLDRSIWTAIGPAPIATGSLTPPTPLTGRAVGVAADPSDVNRIFLAAAGGGVWRTTDGGANWIPLTDDQPTLVMGSLAIAPGNPNVLYAGTGEANDSPDSYSGRGILVSQDGGEHWTLTGQDLFERRTIGEIAVDPEDSNIAYAAVSGLASDSLSGKTGIYKTTDGGLSWICTTDRISQTSQYTSIKIDPADSQVLYAAIGAPTGSSANGVYKSIDGGATWKAAGDFPRSGTGRIQLAIAPSRPAVLYAAVADPRTFDAQAIYKTTDGGSTWSRTTTPPEYLAGQGSYNNFIAVSPADPNVVFAGGSDLGGSAGIIESRDGGQSWASIRRGTGGIAAASPQTNFHSGGFDAQGRLLVVSDGGIWRLDDPAIDRIRWANLNGDLQISQFHGIAIHPSDPNIAYGGTPVNGTVRFNDALGWSQVRGGDGGLVRFDRSGTGLIYHAFAGGTLEASGTGNFWQDLSQGIVGEGNAYAAFQVDQNGRVLFGTDRVNVLPSFGSAWSRLSNPGQAGWPTGGRVDAIEVAETDPGVIYTSVSGAVYITTDNGATWRYSNVTGHAVAAIAIDPTDSRVAYAVRNQRGGSRVLKTTNGGLSWSDISGDLPDLPAHTIQVGKTSAGDVLYLGNDDGVYSSVDGGLHWSRLGSGLPRVRVVELDLNPELGILAAGTYGRGLFELSLKNEPLRLLDNTGFGFRAVGSGWTLESEGLGGGSRAHVWGTGSEYAQWTFGQGAGTHELFATWAPNSMNSPQAFFEIHDGNALIRKVAVNQRLAPSGILTDGAVFQSLGVFTSQTGTITVRLPVSNRGRVSADAVFLAAPYGLDQEPASLLASRGLANLSAGRASILASEAESPGASDPQEGSPAAGPVEAPGEPSNEPPAPTETPLDSSTPPALGILGSGRNQEAARWVGEVFPRLDSDPTDRESVPREAVEGDSVDGSPAARVLALDLALESLADGSSPGKKFSIFLD